MNRNSRKTETERWFDNLVKRYKNTPDYIQEDLLSLKGEVSAVLKNYSKIIAKRYSKEMDQDAKIKHLEIEVVILRQIVGILQEILDVQFRAATGHQSPYRFIDFSSRRRKMEQTQYRNKR